MTVANEMKDVGPTYPIIPAAITGSGCPIENGGGKSGIR